MDCPDRCTSIIDGERVKVGMREREEEGKKKKRGEGEVGREGSKGERKNKREN